MLVRDDLGQKIEHSVIRPNSRSNERLRLAGSSSLESSISVPSGYFAVDQLPHRDLQVARTVVQFLLVEVVEDVEIILVLKGRESSSATRPSGQNAIAGVILAEESIAAAFAAAFEFGKSSVCEPRSFSAASIVGDGPSFSSRGFRR